MTEILIELREQGYSLPFLAGLLLGVIACSAALGALIAAPFAYYRGHRKATHYKKRNHLL